MHLKVRKAALPGWIFLIAALSTEFYWIQVAGGVLRPYHFLVPLLLVFMAPGVGRLFVSSVFKALLLFYLLSLLSVVLSRDPMGAMTSLVLFLLNSSVAVLGATFLNSRQIPLPSFSSFLAGFTVVSAVWALAQFIGFRVGLQLGQSEQQIPQIQAGFAPSFFTEANTYAKFLVVPFFLFLPVLVRRSITLPWLAFYGLLAGVFLINFMRTAFFGAVAALMFVLAWYVWTRSFSRFAARAGGVAALVGVLLVPSLLSGSLLSEYNLYKFTTLFSFDALNNDGSWAYRSQMMTLAIEQNLGDPIRMAFGSGWGQAYVNRGGIERQLGGGDSVNIFTFNGVLGLLAYLAVTGFALRAAARHARWAPREEERIVAEGVLFALVACTIVGQVSGMSLLPHYWLLIGAAISMDCASARERAWRPAQALA